MFVTASARGARPPRAHAAALALQAALVEARAVALSTADATDQTKPTGATVVIAPDPLHPPQGSIITVYRSRPIPNTNAPLFGRGPIAPTSLAQDPGFPPQRVEGTFSARSSTGLFASGSMAILIASSGYASIVAPYRYFALVRSDPGCFALTGESASITVDDGARSETHPIACRDGTYDVASTLPAPAGYRSIGGGGGPPVHRPGP